MKVITNKQFRLFLVYIFMLCFLSSQEKLNFSANTLETSIVEDIEEQIFKENVIIKKHTMTLYTDKAIYYPKTDKVILIDNIKMYDLKDSLFCDSLILYDQINKNFKALNNVKFFQEGNEIKCEKLEYEEFPILKNNKIIKLFDNAEILDSLRVVRGDSIYITYTDSLLNNINILDKGEIFNFRYAKIDTNENSQKIEDYISSKKMFIDFEKSWYASRCIEIST